MKRTLVLKRETLTALSNDDLAGVLGGAAGVPGITRLTESGYSCGIRPCEITEPTLALCDRTITGC